MNKLPEKLIYNPPATNIYRMINSTTGKLVGEMIAIPSDCHQTLIIDRLMIKNSDDRRHGYGRAFLKFAEKLSRSKGYEGRMRLFATTMPQDPFNPPHIFYRKYGFTCDNKDILKKIDKSIKKGRQLDYYTTPQVMMDYYGKEEKPKMSFWEKLKKRIGL